MSPVSRHRDGRSRRARTARTLRRQNKLLMRDRRRVAVQGRNAFATLLAVLAQQGGDVTITQGTLDQINEHLAQMSYSVTPSKEEDGKVKEYKVTLLMGMEESADETADVSGTDHAEETPACTITSIPEEPSSDSQAETDSSSSSATPENSIGTV